MYHLSKRQHSKIILALLSVLLVYGCGDSPKDNYKKREKEIKIKKEAREKKLTELISSIKRQHDPIAFPPSDKNQRYWTYQIQDYISENSENKFLFSCFLEDIYHSHGQEVMDCHVVLSRVLGSQNIALIKLRVDETQVSQLLHSGLKGHEFSSRFRYWADPDLLVVASIDSIEKARRYEAKAIPEGSDETSLSIETPLHVVGSGTLLDYYRTPDLGE